MKYAKLVECNFSLSEWFFFWCGECANGLGSAASRFGQHTAHYRLEFRFCVGVLPLTVIGEDDGGRRGSQVRVLVRFAFGTDWNKT